MDFDESTEAKEDDDQEMELNELFPIEDEAKSTDPTRDSLFFIIDCSAQMQSIIPTKNTSLFQMCIDAYINFCKTKIISTAKDNIGLILYNTKTTANQLNLPSIWVLQKLGELDANKIKEGMNIASKATAVVPSTAPAEMSEVLSVVSIEFKLVEKENTYKRIFIFTSNDDPTTAISRQMCLQRFNDIANSGIIIELFPLYNGVGNRFDVKKFYADAISFDEEEINAYSNDEFVGSRIDEINSRIRQKEYRKRVQASVMLHLTPKMSIGVCVYNLVNKAKIPFSNYVEAKTNKLVKTLSKWICNETGKELIKSEIGHFLELSEFKIKFTEDEIKNIKKFDEPGFKLMGFKPADRLKPYHNYKSSLFLSANENSVIGSSQVMSALITSMIELNQIGIGKLVPKANSSLRFVALLPQAAGVDPDGYKRSAGFHVIFLPYGEDMRSPESVIEKAPKDESTQADIDVARQMVDKLTFNFSSKNFQNYNLQKFYSSLQAIALNEKTAYPVENLLVQDKAGFAKYSDEIDKFKELVDLNKVNASKPRKAQGDSDQPRKKKASKKKAKKEQDDDD